MNVSKFKRMMIGSPFPTSMEMHERLDKFRGLAIFASDPISSNAYATEAIMSVLILLGTGALSLTIPIALGISLLVLLVVFSYIQTILHYPNGGGSYIVAKDNLGTLPSLMAAGALLTDYILTVSVSVSAGVRAITSAFPGAHDYRVWIALLAIAFLTWMNLRGIKESGTIFALPTYAFIVGVILIIVIGLVRQFGWFGTAPLEIPAAQTVSTNPLTGFAYIWLLLRAFAAGCTALTGIEAISDGVQAFKAPETKNAAKTMVAMAVIAMSLFVGISYLATHMNLLPSHQESILSQMTRIISNGGFLYYWVQLFTMAILILAANTGYQDFPRLSYFLARDKFLPRWMMNRGDRLVYSSGIVTLAVVSSFIVIIFQANEIAMLPLYAIGVMISFTVSQLGMFRLMKKVGNIPDGESIQTMETTLKFEKNWRLKRMLSFVGALTTFVVLIILIVTKFQGGAWFVVTAIPLLIMMFYSVNKHYQQIARALRTKDLNGKFQVEIADVAIVPIADVHKASLRAIQYARRFSEDVRVIHISTEHSSKARFMKRWQRFSDLTDDVQLDYVQYDFRDVLTPLVKYINDIKENEFPGKLVTVIIPEFITPSIPDKMLHNHTADFLCRNLRHQEDVVIIEVPYHISSIQNEIQMDAAMGYDLDAPEC
ncbi:MAG: APC family permease [Anaerolineaceae bacterium]|nr:APC family permease [Anaerolineaceae bacterium]